MPLKAGNQLWGTVDGALIHARNVTVNELRHSDNTLVGCQVEYLRLNACALHCTPFEILFLEFCIWRVLRLRGHRLYGRWTIFGFLRPGDICEPDRNLSVDSTARFLARLTVF